MAAGQESEAGESMPWDDSCFCPECCDKTLVIVWFVVFPAKNTMEAVTIGVGGNVLWTGVGAENLGVAIPPRHLGVPPGVPAFWWRGVLGIPGP